MWINTRFRESISVEITYFKASPRIGVRSKSEIDYKIYLVLCEDMDSSEMESSHRDNLANNNDNIIINNNNSRNNNRVLIPGPNSSGSVSPHCESDERENYGDHLSFSRDGKSLNNNSSGPTDCSNHSPRSRPGSSERSYHCNDVFKSETDVGVTAPSSHHGNGFPYDHQNSINGNHVVPSMAFPEDAQFSEKNKVNSCDKDSLRENPFRTLHDAPGDGNNDGFKDVVGASSSYNCASDNQSVDRISSSGLAARVQNGDVMASSGRAPSPNIRQSSPDIICHNFSTPSTNNSHSAPSTSAKKFLPASLNSAEDVTSESVGEESASPKNSVKKDFFRKNANPLGQNQNEAPGRKSALNVPMAVARSLPIHCVIEQSPNEAADDHSWTSSEEFQIVNDTYAILPGNTLFTDIVWTSLSRLNYSSEEATAATGGIQLKNWQTLDFEVITDNEEATVEEMLGEIISVATLRIRLASNVSDIPQDRMKQKLVQLLYSHSKDFLIATGCPIEKTLLDAVAQGDLSQAIAEPVCTAFNVWYNQRLKRNSSSPEMEHDEQVHGVESKLKPHVEKHQKPTLSSSSSSSMASDGVEKMDISDAEKPLSSAPPSAPMSQSMSPLKSSLFCTSSSPFKGGKKNETTAAINSMHYSNQPIKSERINSKFDVLPSSQNHQQENQQHKQPLLSHHHAKHDLANSVNQKILSEYPSDRQDKLSLSNCDANLAMSFQSHPSNPYMGIMPGKTRIRTSFDPEHEIPRLQKWFSDNQHPTREQMTRFMQELNNLESRKGRRPLDLTNIIYWFKNARAAQRRASKALDDSFENEENLDVNNSATGGSNSGETVPPYLPNKNAVYMIPFHPYPHLISKSGNPCPSENGVNGLDPGSMANGCDEPYDLSVSKRSYSESGKSSTSNEIGSSDSGGEHLNFCNSPTTPKMSPESSEDMTRDREFMKRKLSAQCPPPRFPALLDVASKMRREIPPTSEDVYNNNSNATSNVSAIHAGNNEHNNRAPSPCRPSSRSSDVDNVYKTGDLEQPYLDQTIHPRDNGFLMSPHHVHAMKMKCEDRRYDSDANIPKKKKHYNFDRSSDLELGQIKKEEVPISQSNGNINCSDDENTNDSYDSEEELKMRMKQNVAAVADYASAMHNNVSRLTAANMAALSLAQMGQPLHIPQLAPSLAMAYYPMDPRFYSQPPVSSSLPSSSSPTPTSSHLTPHQGQTTPNSLLDSSSPLPSPSSVQHSIGQHSQHHHHRQQQQHQQQQQQNPRHHSEPRKRRTRVFIDPLSEIPKLEKWFKEDTHPSAFMIDKYCEELNKCEYRQKFPKLEPKNVQLWFKNHRAKVKRLKVSFNGSYEDGDEYVGEAGFDGDGDIKSENFDIQ